MVSSFLITFREALEAALIVSILLAYPRSGTYRLHPARVSQKD
jgi:high-affinity Fe2+/Pb2+ permease